MSAKKPGRGRIYNSIVDTIGDTPLVRLDKFAKEKGVVAHWLQSLSSSIQLPRSKTGSALP